MKQLTYIALSVVALLSMGNQAVAADVAVIHGINGRDLGLARQLPVDISVNGACALKGVAFKQSANVELGAGDYEVKVFVATGSCSGSPVIQKKVTIPKIAENEAFALVASLSAKGKPQLAVFQNTGNTFSSPGVAVRHLAKAGDLGVRLALREGNIRIPSLLAILRNGKEAGSYILGGTSFTYEGWLQPRGAKRITVPRTLVNRASRIFYVVGSAKNGFTLITQTIKLP